MKPFCVCYWFGVIGYSLLFSVQFASSILHPDVIWSSKNDLFSCNQPIINVSLYDYLDFLCPINTYETTELYYLGTDSERFNSCNVTGSRQELKCSVNQKVKRITFRDHQTGPNSLKFETGKKYYFVGTESRGKTHLVQMESGCNSTEPNSFKMRLAVYVCTNEEVKNGLCKTCSVSSCYTDACRYTCSNWSMDSEGTNPDAKRCLLWHKRFCFDAISQRNKTEYWKQEITCPTEATQETDRSTATSTSSQSTKDAASTNRLTSSTDTTMCCSNSYNTAKSKAMKDEDRSQITIFVLSAALIPAALFGVFIGYVLRKKHHEKKALNKQMHSNTAIKTDSKVGFFNQAYHPSLSSIYPSVSETPDNNAVSNFHRVSTIPECSEDYDDAFEKQSPVPQQIFDFDDSAFYFSPTIA